jgi:uracil-DNA glycosylase
LLGEVRACTLCASKLAHAVRPVLQIDSRARVLVSSQAPGRKVHESGVPFDDASGERLREWMGITPQMFYDPQRVAILPMAFCFPGAGKSGDLAPRPECAPAWRAKILAHLNSLEITLVIGQYAQSYHFGSGFVSVTDTVRNWRASWPEVVPLPHPSPRNNLWIRRNPWFEEQLLPMLRKRVSTVLD